MYPVDIMYKRALSKGIASLALLAVPVLAQTPASAPAFEVASIKPAPPVTALAAQIQAGKMHVGMSVDGARVDIGFMSLGDLLPLAFKVKPYQVTGPDWMRQERWDILAKIPDGGSKDQVPEMLLALLTDRFKLAVHRDTKELPIYALVVGKNGPKLKESTDDTPAGDANSNGLAVLPPPPPPPPGGGPGRGGPPPGPGRGAMVIGTPQGQMSVSATGRGAEIKGGPNGNMRINMGENGVMRMEMSKMTMAALADSLAPFVDRPVIDETGLKGNYQVTLEMPMEDLMRMARARVPEIANLPGAGGGGPGAGGAAGAPTASDPSGSSIFQTVQQLGLRLEPRKAPVETIVVDHLEKTPTEN
jgi:uncharacterized protein (TIGR03435 family)